MAAAVAEALELRTDLVVEAGTGTGKTLAYLLPILHSGQRAIIATATKHLQSQLLSHDIPLALQAAGVHRSVAVLKGRSNYLCHLRLEKQLTLHRYSLPISLMDAERIARSSETGERQEVLGLAEDDPVWPDITSTADNCLGQECPHQDQCFVLAARRRAMDADLVVVNHHLLFADYAVRERFEQGGILPDVGAVVIDEAHALAETAAAFFGAQLSERRVLGWLDEVRLQLPGVPDATLRGPLSHLAEEGARATQRLFNAVRQERVGETLRKSSLDRLGPHAMEVVALLAQIHEHLDEPLLAADPLWRKLGDGVFALQQDLERTLFPAAGNDEVVRWVEQRRSDVVVLSRPVDVAPILQRTLLQESAVRIFTSATLMVAGDFAHFAERLGLPADVPTLTLPSPFDFAQQALLYVPENLPDPYAPDRDAHVARLVVDLATTAGGACFALFSSRRAMEDAVNRGRAELSGMGMEVLVQGQSPRESLLARFAKAQPAVLFATMGFWQGVDLPADVLRVVILDKIPFPPPDDPVLAARAEKYRASGRDPFDHLWVPMAATALRQGFGRLIRSNRHWGAVALLDPRLLRKRYGQVLLDSLPPARRTRSFPEVRAFLAREDPSTSVGAQTPL